MEIDGSKIRPKPQNPASFAFLDLHCTYIFYTFTQMSSFRFGLRARLFIPFLLFAILGSALLTMLMLGWTRRQARQAFERQAISNAEFFATTKLPRSAQISEWLGRVLDAEVAFRHPYTDATELPASDERVEAVIDDSTLLTLTRPRPRWQELMLRPLPLASLAAFWLAGLGAATLLTRGILRPLLSFTRAVPEIATLKTLPGEERQDEIGDLARTFRATHEARMQAEKSSALGDLAASFAHEIKNPITAANMHLELLEDQTTAGIVREQLDRVTSLANQWQFMLRPDAPSKSQLSVAELLEDVRRRQQARAEHAEVVLDFHCDPSLELAGDRFRLQQVFDNLTVNAIQAMPDGGTLQVRAKQRPGAASIAFEDEGTGFSEAALARAGERFFSTREGGMGIGLHVSRSIVEAHDGTLQISNRTDCSGARITINLPA